MAAAPAALEAPREPLEAGPRAEAERAWLLDGRAGEAAADYYTFFQALLRDVAALAALARRGTQGGPLAETLRAAGRAGSVPLLAPASNVLSRAVRTVSRASWREQWAAVAALGGSPALHEALARRLAVAQAAWLARRAKDERSLPWWQRAGRQARRQLKGGVEGDLDTHARERAQRHCVRVAEAALDAAQGKPSRMAQGEAPALRDTRALFLAVLPKGDFDASPPGLELPAAAAAAAATAAAEEEERQAEAPLDDAEEHTYESGSELAAVAEAQLAAVAAAAAYDRQASAADSDREDDGDEAKAPAGAAGGPLELIDASLVEVDTGGDELGRGAFGSVHAGRYLGADVAVKVLHTESVDAFLAEARTHASMRHPHVAHVMGVAAGGAGSLLLVMERCRHGSLAQYLDARPALGAAERAELARQAASGMAYLHSRGVLHLDLKAGNLLVAAGPAVRVSDFGLARHVTADAEYLRGHMAGTVVCMSPEQFLSARAGRATDVFAFALVLYRVFVGRAHTHGFTAEERATWPYRMVSGERPELPPAVPPAAAELIRACWAHDAAARPSFAEIHERLERLAAGDGTA